MKFLNLTLASPALNLALDEALLLDAEAGGPEVLRLWEWDTPAVILGASGRRAVEIHEDACLRDGVPIGRRSSGGGTVLLGRGCLLFSLILSYERHPALGELHPSYRYILGQLCSALQPLVPDLVPAGISDLALGDRKVSGNSQQRKRTHLLHHGTLLYNFDLALLSRYLRPPPRQPEYRQGRGHVDFVTNLAVSREELIQRLRDGWDATEEWADWPTDLVKQLAAVKYEREEWIGRR